MVPEIEIKEINLEQREKISLILPEMKHRKRNSMGEFPSYSQDKSQASQESESMTINFTGKKYIHAIKKDSEKVDSHRFKELYNLYQTSS